MNCTSDLGALQMVLTRTNGICEKLDSAEGTRQEEMDKDSFIMDVLRRRRQVQNPHWIRFEDTNTSTSAKQDHSWEYNRLAFYSAAHEIKIVESISAIVYRCRLPSDGMEFQSLWYRLADPWKLDWLTTTCHLLGLLTLLTSLFVLRSHKNTFQN